MGFTPLHSVTYRKTQHFSYNMGKIKYLHDLLLFMSLKIK